jgi:Holliday junction DNA helicase RuvA
MIGWIKGNVRAVDPAGFLILDVGGVGYKVNVPQFMVDIPVGGELELFVHTHVREDAITLYGFATDAERLAFEKLLGAHGVGPSLGLSILSVLGVGDLYDVVASENIDLLCTVPGIGRKTAAKLAIDLKSSIDVLAAAQDSMTGVLSNGSSIYHATSDLRDGEETGGNEGGRIGGNDRVDGIGSDGRENGSSSSDGRGREKSVGSRSVDGARARSEARSALTSLGYSPEEIRVAMRDTGGAHSGAGSAQSVEDILRNALKQLNNNRGM